jgi:hypothetical protein
MTPPQPPPASSAADILAALQTPDQQQPQAPDSPVASYYIPQTSQPEYQPLPHAEDHHSMLGRIMDRVATILGGDETYRIHKDTDGNMTVEKDPSTRTEKWGRIASAALGGAAKGMQVGQGPGGAARAVSAGFQQGVQMPQQQKDNLQQDVTNQQKAMLFKANMAALNQKTAIGALTLKANGIKFATDVAGMLNEQSEHAANAPGTVDFGVTETPQDAFQLHKTKPDLFAGHPQGKVVTYPEVASDGSVKGFHSYLVDPAWMNQRNDKPLPAFGMVYNAATKQYEPQRVGTIAVGGVSNGDYALQSMDFATKSSTIAKNYADADKASQDKTATPKTALEAQSAADAEPDPVKRAAKQATADKMQKMTIAEKVAGRNITTNAPSYTPPAGTQIQTTTKSGQPVWGRNFGGGDPNSAFENQARQLALGEKLEKDIPKRIAKGQPSPADYSNRARQISQDMFGPQYEYNPQQTQKEAAFAGQEKVIAAYNAMDRVAGNPNTGKTRDSRPPLLDQIEAAADAAGLGDAAPINDVVQWAKRFWGDDAAKNLQADLAEVRKSLAQVTGNPTLGSSDTNMKLQQMSESYGSNMTLSNLKSVNKEMRDAIETERATGFRTNRFLRRDYGGESITAQPTGGGGPTPTPTGGGKPPTPPPGATVQVPGSDGKMHWSDGKRDLGVVGP